MTRRVNTPTQKPQQKNIVITIIAAIGGIAGLVTIVGLIFQLLSYQQDLDAREADDISQATLIAILHAQLEVQEAIATSQVKAANVSEPEAAMAAATIAALSATQAALQAQQAAAEATLTALPQIRTNPETIVQVIPGSASSSAAVESQIDGVSAELHELSLFQNTITAKIRFSNSGTGEQTLALTANSYLFDNANQRKHLVTDESNSGPFQTLPANSTLDVWGKYALPEGEVPQYVDLVLPNGVIFEHLEVKRE